MPTVNINRKVLEKIIGKKLPEETLKDRISMLGTDLEKMDENEIIVEIFPNRPDMLSEQGFGRALSSFIGVNTGLRKYNVKPSGYKVIVDKSVEMRPYTACAIIKNIKFTDEKIREIMQMQEKLATTHGRRRKKSAYGIYPVEHINFPIKYVALDPAKVMFQPLGFDKKMIATETEKVHPTAKDFKYIADSWKKAGHKKYPFFIDAKENAMCMLPYTNSHDTGKVDINTKEVFIECTGVDFRNINYALNIFVTMFADMGADIYSMEIVYPDKTVTTPDLSPRKMEIDIEYVNKWLGLNLSEKDLKLYLERMGYGYSDKHALIPCYRPDVIHQVDLAEDIAVAYGYENFLPEIPKRATTGHEDSFEKFRKKVAYILVGLGYLETNSYHITNKEIQFAKMLLKAEDFVELANSKSEDFNLMRYSMLPNMMQILMENTHNEYPQNIFESGYVFRQDLETDTGIREDNKLAIVLCSSDADYTKAKQALDYLFKSIGLEYEIKEGKHPSFIDGRAGKVLLKGKEIGFIGEVHPQVLENFAVEVPVAAVEIDLGEVFRILK